ncbi:hypothetical protein INT45_008218 [Circinella minor]|uniref:F-box domain-containing protein n=1 Tax=Circinella minor TaxID=1195481 RepID=A0A8H7S130_9FUNG|nr:hypothetical protein INT45_008218 [Circinella minor]
MDNTITLLKSMTNDTMKALSSGDYKSATFRLNMLYRETMRSIYEAQFLNYKKMGHFDLALQYAMQMIQLIPDSYSGYLYAGDCLFEQSKLYQAMSFYNQGLNQRRKQSTEEDFDDQHRKNASTMTADYNNDNDKWLLLLNSRRKQVSTQLNYRVSDWIHRLPFGVVCVDILPYLSMQERRTCLNVSRSWRSLISGCANLWRTLEFHGTRKKLCIDNNKNRYDADGDAWVVVGNDDSDDENNNNNDLLKCIGAHATRVTLSQMSDQQLQVVFEKIVQPKCTRLKSFCFYECSASVHQIAVYLNQISRNNAIQYLEIYQHQQSFSLEQLLYSCPTTLTHLYFKQNPSINNQCETVKKAILPIIRASTASASSSSRDNNNKSNNYTTQQQQSDNSSNSNTQNCKEPIDHMLYHCPNLEYLVLENRSQLDFYQYTQLCPNLHHFQHNIDIINRDKTIKKFPFNSIWDTIIKYNDNNGSSHRSLSLCPSFPSQQQQKLSFTAAPREIDNNKNTQLVQQPRKLRHLILGKSKISNQERINIKRIVEQNRDSLETFTLHGVQGDQRNWAWVFGGILDPYRLVHLDLSVEIENSLIPLLRHSASTLKYVALHSMLCVNDNVLDVLGVELPGLRQLKLLDCINVTERGMARLVGDSSFSSDNNSIDNNTKEYSAPCLLEHLEIVGYSFCLTEHVLELIGKMPNLKRFKLSWCGFGSTMRMDRLVESMVTCHSRVEYLSFTRSSIHADTLDMLGNLTNLQYLKICMCTNVTNLGVRRLIDKKLKEKSFYLKIAECNLLDSKLIDYAHNMMGDHFRYIKC